MSVAALQYSKFCSEVAETGRAFTFLEDSSFLVYPVNGTEVVPFWSSRTRLVRISKAHPKYARYQICEFPMENLLSSMTQLQSEGILVGVNWSGPKLTGFNVSVPDLRAALMQQLGADA
jgi:hypothetical protein